ELLHEEFPEGDERQADMLEILKAGRRAVGLTRQLLTFSRQQPVAPRPTDLNSNLAELNKLLARTVGENIELSLVLSTRPAIAHIDPIQFDQIVLNLAVNARDAMPDGGRLEIALDHCAPSEVVAGPGFVRLTVTDTGDGMDGVTLQRIFEPYCTAQQVGHGRGLGLATCGAITEEADGTIAVQSTLGEGTKFTVDLPLWTGRRVSQELSLEDAAPAG